jgi:hypothetical protein
MVQLLAIGASVVAVRMAEGRTTEAGKQVELEGKALRGRLGRGARDERPEQTRAR